MSNPVKSHVQIRVRRQTIPYRGKRIKAKDHKGMLPNAQPWPWQVNNQEK